MKKFIGLAVLVLFVAIFAGSYTVSVYAQVSNGGDDVGAPASAPAAGESAASVTNGGDDTSASSGSTGSTGSGSTGSVTNGSDDLAGSPTTPSNGNGGGSTSTGGGGGAGPSGSGSSSTSGGSNSGSTEIPVITVTATSSCPLITNMLKLGIANDPVQVAKLQAFLKNVEKIDVEVTGTFDVATENAVKAFQKKYVDVVLLPWGGPKASGIVYITTMKKINQIACQSALTLSATELSIIQDFINKRLAGQGTGSSVGDIVIANTNSFSSSTLEAAINGNSLNIDLGDTTASAGNTSFAARFWNFIIGLFR